MACVHSALHCGFCSILPINVCTLYVDFSIHYLAIIIYTPYSGPPSQLSFSQLRQAAQNDEPVYFMLTPPDQPDPGLLQDCYVDTSTLQWLYDPPIGVVGGQLPEHMNLSSKRLFSCR